jgi:hypothetical protein
MPIFDDLIPAEHLWPVHAPRPLMRARGLIVRFREQFPTITYDLFWETGLMNAQAFFGREGRCVRLYGGLGRHRRVGVEGLAFALAHETGHHLGGPPLHPFYSSISSEERANEWAMELGLQQVFGSLIGRRYGRNGLTQLNALASEYSLKSVMW